LNAKTHNDDLGRIDQSNQESVPYSVPEPPLASGLEVWALALVPEADAKMTTGVDHRLNAGLAGLDAARGSLSVETIGIPSE
jgi:hypothetical protein